MADSTRRRFLEMAGAAAAASVCGCSSSAPPALLADVPAGNLSALKIGTLQAVNTDPVCIARDAGGVYAMTLTCTHQGCNMAGGGAVSEQLIQCPCHGSQFDGNGNVVRGPASAPLAHFAVSIDGSGNLTIHGSTEVSESTRLAV